MTIVLVAGIGFSFFVLYKNDWSLDLANVGVMVDRAFGGGTSRASGDETLRGLEVSVPIVSEAELSDGTRVLTAEGLVKNNDTRARKFIYVRASLKDGHDRTVARAEAPAGNVFSKTRLAQLSPTKLRSSMNPAGRDGRNAKLEPGETVAYMVVFTAVPHDYSATEHEVEATVSEAELYAGP
jgi:hypothetical protein